MSNVFKLQRTNDSTKCSVGVCLSLVTPGATRGGAPAPPARARRPSRAACGVTYVGTHWVQWALDSTQTRPYTGLKQYTAGNHHATTTDQRKHTTHKCWTSTRRSTRQVYKRRVQGMQAAHCDTWVAWCVGCTQAAPPLWPSHAYGRCGPRSTKHLYEYMAMRNLTKYSQGTARACTMISCLCNHASRPPIDSHDPRSSYPSPAALWPMKSRPKRARSAPSANPQACQASAPQPIIADPATGCVPA